MMLDLPQTHLEIVLRLILSVSLGGLIGLERQVWHKPAGFRTSALVCLGATLFTILSLTPFLALIEAGTYDASRMISQIVVGIGFIGGGVIMHRDNHVEGVTTASTLWVASAIGIAVALGYYLEAFFSTFLVLGILVLLGQVELKLTAKKPVKKTVKELQ